MPISIDLARTFVGQLQVQEVENLFAQAFASHVLHEVKEAPENFPQFDPNLHDRVTFAAYLLLASGCSVIEQGERFEGNGILEHAAAQLQYVHGPHIADSHERSFHVFVAAMAFYASGQYSRAFVTARSVAEPTAAMKIICAYLRKETFALDEQLDNVLLRETPDFQEESELDEWAITVAIARSIAYASEFIRTGQPALLNNADDQLSDAIIIASAGNYPAWWWVVRLLRLMLRDLGNASPWQVLPPYFDNETHAALSGYIRHLAFLDRPVSEIWTSQRAALPLALNSLNRGAVINLRTSAGKTRIAEFAILQTLLTNPDARIFYLAPFRSLAFEVEHSLGATFTKIGYRVSHLYGGFRASTVDIELADEAAITIATPEKTRALFRSAPELFQNVKLFIVDEGHLIGDSERDVRNEIFLDHLRIFAREKGARILLLSAVLPNAQEVAEWITGTQSAVARSEWKPSTERQGLLRWTGSRVKIDWLGKVPSYNPSFVESKPLGFGKRKNQFPNNKYEAVASTAIRLSEMGPVMIFIGKAVSVPTLAKAVLLALGKDPLNHQWPQHEWQIFQTICQEELASDAIEIKAAQAGVICHSNRLTPQVRLAMEGLMRRGTPKIIIATKTLAQGVNVGVSSVIVASPYIHEDKKISTQDFWNICGRAGRAFVDGEGKVLYAIDHKREDWQIRNDECLAQSYFHKSVSDPVKSGLLAAVNELRNIALQAGATFEVLLELAANNDFSILGNNASRCTELCDYVDDELLALHIDAVINPSAEENPVVWIEKVFRESLAAIQARAGISGVGSEDILGFLQARAKSALQRTEEPIRRAVVASGLPLSTALKTRSNLDFFTKIANNYQQAEGALPTLIAAVREIENWVRSNATAVVQQMPDIAVMDEVRQGWLEGTGIQIINLNNDSSTAKTKKE
ncbi:MAG: DEAD/DEAH box helicase, partial [Acidobacteria bacterium]|nr:DEAD/DEAH box helicase [Acidobacteriota bacterium]